MYRLNKDKDETRTTYEIADEIEKEVKDELGIDQSDLI